MRNLERFTAVPRSIDLHTKAQDRGRVESNSSKEQITRQRLLERIPVAGLHNLLHAEGRKEKFFWVSVLMISTIITLYYFIPCLVKFSMFTKVVEIQHSSEPQLPFPVVHVCGLGAINGTYLNGAFEQFLPQLKQDSRIQRLARTFRTTVRTLVWFTVAYVTQEPNFEPYFDKNMVPAFNEIIYKVIQLYGSNWPGMRIFYEESAYKCGHFLDQCTFNGFPFPCCGGSRWEPILIYAMTCFKLNASDLGTGQNVNSMASHARPPTMTFKSTINRLYMPAQINRRPATAVFFGNTPSVFAADVSIPDWTKAVIQISGKRRKLMDDCIESFHLDEDTEPIDEEFKRYLMGMTIANGYSPEKCTMAHMVRQLYNSCGCVPFFDTLRPNDSRICTPAHVYSCVYKGYHTVVSSENTIAGSGNAGNRKMAKATMDLMTSKRECLDLCDTWTYDAHLTFTSLAAEMEDSGNIIYNEVVLMVDPEYRMEIDALKFDLISFFTAIGDGLSLFLGISVVAFLQTAFWGVAAIRLPRKRRLVSPYQQNLASNQKKAWM